MEFLELLVDALGKHGTFRFTWNDRLISDANSISGENAYISYVVVYNGKLW